MKEKIITTGLFLVVLLCASHINPTHTQSIEDIVLPSGFHIDVFAQVPTPREMVISDKGIIYVSSTANNSRVFALIDDNNDYHIDRTVLVTASLPGSFGLLYIDAALYVVQHSQIVAFKDIDYLVLTNQTNENTPYVVINSQIPRSPYGHERKIARVQPGTKRIFVPIGYPGYEGTPLTNVSWIGPTDPATIGKWDEDYGKIIYLDPPYTNFIVYAHGVRNSVGLDWDPLTNDLWFTDNTHNGLGQEIPGEEINRAPVPGLHFGYPYCHGHVSNEPTLAPGWKCPNGTVTAAVLAPAHSAPINMIFYRGTQFPPAYHKGIFFTLHGPNPTYVPSEPTRGSNINFIALDPVYREPLKTEVFASGWIKPANYSTRWGRPAGLLELSDGSLLVSDDLHGAIYRITYSN